MRWLLLVLALAGCDKLLLSEIPLPEIDAPVVDHNEDGDGVGDADDNCPTVSGSQADTDRDGVGDLCDPNPSSPDKIARLYTFQATSAEFIPVSGSWTVTGDTLVHMGHTNTSDYWKYVARQGLTLVPPYVIDAQFKVTVVEDGSEFSVSAGLDASDTGSFCTIKFYDTHTELHAYNPTSDARTDRMPPLDRAATFTMRLTATSTSLRCVLTSSLEGDTAATSPLRVGDGPTGFESRNADATADYMIIYTPR